MNAQQNESTWSEELKVSGEAVIDTVKDLLHEGNVRRITIKHSNGKTLMSIPVTVGVLGVLVAPTAAAVGAIVALGADYTLEIERSEPSTSSSAHDGADGVTTITESTN